MPKSCVRSGDPVIDERKKDPGLTELTVLLGKDDQQAKRKKEKKF